jgi:hypothetical protein
MIRNVLPMVLVAAVLTVPIDGARAQDDWGVVGRCADLENVDRSLLVPLPSRRPGTNASQWSGTVSYRATYDCTDCEGLGSYSWTAQHVYKFTYGQVTASGTVRERQVDIGVPNSGIVGEHVARGDVIFSRVSIDYSPLWQPIGAAKSLRNVYPIQVGCTNDSKSPLIEGTYTEKGVGGGDSFTEPRTKRFGTEPYSHELSIYAQGPANTTTLTGTYTDQTGHLRRTWTVNLRRSPPPPTAPKKKKP